EVWDVDPERDRWNDATITAFARLSYEQQASWFRQQAALVTRTPRWSDGGHGVIWDARWSPDGTRVAATGADGTVSVYDAATGTVLQRAAPGPAAFHGLSWHPTGQVLAAGAADKRIYLFAPASGSVIDTLTGHDDVVTAVAWSPDGTTLASTAGGPLLILKFADASGGPAEAVRLWRWRWPDALRRGGGRCRAGGALPAPPNPAPVRTAIRACSRRSSARAPAGASAPRSRGTIPPAIERDRRR